jgi:hypothetical protein
MDALTHDLDEIEQLLCQITDSHRQSVSLLGRANQFVVNVGRNYMHSTNDDVAEIKQLLREIVDAEERTLLLLRWVEEMKARHPEITGWFPSNVSTLTPDRKHMQ